MDKYIGDAVMALWNAPEPLPDHAARACAAALAGREAAQRLMAGAAFAFRLVDVVAVKGRRQGVAVHELLGAAGDVPPERTAAARLYEEAFAAYRARRFDEALEKLAGLADDPAGRVLAARCRAFRDSPPAPDWDGVHTASEK